MAEDSHSEFRFECEGIEVEIRGSREFVETMYRQIMRDIDRARPADESIQPDPPASSSSPAPPDEHVVWVVSRDEMIQRVYMTEAANVEASPLGRALDAERIGTLYTDAEGFEGLLPRVADREETLWAKLTEAGRRRISGGFEA